MGKSTQIHGEGVAEFMLCGLACDAFESGDHHEPVVSARPGEMVTCPDCRQMLDRVRREFKGYRAALKSTSPDGGSHG